MAIDKFKTHKIQLYTKMFQGMSTHSIHNAYFNAISQRADPLNIRKDLN